MTLYTTRSRAGKLFSVESDLTDDEAQNVITRKGDLNSFQAKLATTDTRRLGKLRPWLHIVAMQILTPKPETVTTEDTFLATLGLLESAFAAGKKFPKVKLIVDGRPFVLARVGSGRNEGCVNISDGSGYGQGVWYGRLNLDGSFHVGQGDTAFALSVLNRIEEDPARVASQHGIATGNCCFCSIELTTKESRSVGYGPVCAGKFGLPWGDVDPELDAKGKELEL